ncbi:hypothetical protein, partial [Bacteroides intestinalis]|uniref:hypothetical protein n=1 Tax=Bacteroides intestinalis TaxID=329854 RepID=UPI0022E971A2
GNCLVAVFLELYVKIGRQQFKRFRSGYIGRARHALTLTAQKNPSLFVYWACGYKLYMKRIN